MAKGENENASCTTGGFIRDWEVNDFLTPMILMRLLGLAMSINIP